VNWPDDYLDRIICGDALEVMRQMPDGCVDAVITDPPYGITACKWDTMPDLEELWAVLKMIGKGSCVYIFTASQPFTSKLVISNLKWFRHEWIWNKDKAGNIMCASYQPMKVHENILVFAKKKTKFNRQLTEAKKENIRPAGRRYDNRQGIFGERSWQHSRGRDNTKRNPKTIINISSVSAECNNLNRKHPTQKPVALMEYLIKTYTDEGDVVLDPYLGSGTTAVAAKQLGRHWIGVDISPECCAIARERIEAVLL